MADRLTGRFLPQSRYLVCIKRSRRRAQLLRLPLECTYQQSDQAMRSDDEHG